MVYMSTASQTASDTDLYSHAAQSICKVVYYQVAPLVRMLLRTSSRIALLLAVPCYFRLGVPSAMHAKPDR